MSVLVWLCLRCWWLPHKVCCFSDQPIRLGRSQTGLVNSETLAAARRRARVGFRRAATWMTSPPCFGRGLEWFWFPTHGWNHLELWTQIRNRDVQMMGAFAALLKLSKCLSIEMVRVPCLKKTRWNPRTRMPTRRITNPGIIVMGEEKGSVSVKCKV